LTARSVGGWTDARRAPRIIGSVDSAQRGRVDRRTPRAADQIRLTKEQAAGVVVRHLAPARCGARRRGFVGVRRRRRRPVDAHVPPLHLEGGVLARGFVIRDVGFRV
jgi:hypothetical protein